MSLSVQDLTVNYDRVPVLNGLNFTIPGGHLVGIVGPNGAGKSTLLKAIMGLVKPCSGKILIGGNAFKQLRKKAAYVPQRSSVDWDFPITVLDLVLMGAYGRLGIFRWPGKKERKEAEQALEKVGMLAFADRQINALSGGQKQRAFLARAFMQEADWYFLDEPFAGVDAATEKAIISLLKELKTEGKSLFVVHHDLNTVSRYFDWLILLNTQLIASGPTQEIFTSEAIEKTYGSSVVVFHPPTSGN